MRNQEASRINLYDRMCQFMTLPIFISLISLFCFVSKMLPKGVNKLSITMTTMLALAISFGMRFDCKLRDFISLESDSFSV